MRISTCFVLLIAISAGMAFAEDVPAPAPKGKVELKTQKEKASYAIGLDIGKNIKRTGVEIAPELVAKGIADVIAGTKPLLSDEEIRAVMLALQKEMQTKAEAGRKAIAEKNIKDGKAFLEANKKKPGVKTLASGLQYKVLKSGTGKTPKATDAVKANYKGTLIDGTQFDASTEPATFRVRGVIPGWTEALQLMKVGDKWQVFIPSELAYGEDGTPDGAIGPSAVLIFEMELVGIVE
jgi:FKBP-type peptidyl-prolyl cis-trans isomerase